MTGGVGAAFDLDQGSFGLVTFSEIRGVVSLGWTQDCWRLNDDLGRVDLVRAAVSDATFHRPDSMHRRDGLLAIGARRESDPMNARSGP